MGTPFILAGLLCLCGVSLSHACRPGLLVNVDFPGADIIHIFSPDAEHCQFLCTQHPSCLFFTFLRSDWKRDNRHFFCYLKSSPSGQPKVQSQLQGHTSGFSLKPCHPDPQPCLSAVYHQVDFQHANYRTLFTADHEECQRECTNDPACQLFTYFDKDFPVGNIRYKCHLKFTWRVPRIPTITRVGVVVSGFSQRLRQAHNNGPACKDNIFPRTNIPGHDIEVLPAVSPEHCQTFCSVHPHCTFFSYVSHNFKCYLKKNPGVMTSKPETGVTSGLPARFCQLNDNWIKMTYVGINFPHSDIRNFLTNGVEECQRACTEDPNCQFFSYVTNPPVHRHCFLKRVTTMPAPAKVVKLAHSISGFSLRNCYQQGPLIQQWH